VGVKRYPLEKVGSIDPPPDPVLPRSIISGNSLDLHENFIRDVSLNKEGATNLASHPDSHQIRLDRDLCSPSARVRPTNRRTT